MKLKNDFSAALLKEIVLRKDYLEGEEVNTIYFGGGTPSLLEAHQLERMINALYDNYTIHPDAEFTFEANPDDITSANCKLWKQHRINRLSVGIQSFFADDLAWMNRAHNDDQAAMCIRVARDAGFRNMSIDLIYGTPTLNDENWIRNLEIAVSFKIPHLSCYALTVEPGTALHAMTAKKKVLPVESEQQARQFLIMTDYLQANGYEHYEISNFALAGMRSRHNSSYWNGAKYLGLGPSAHSFNGASRQWNVANNSLYIKSLAANEVPFEQEVLSIRQQFNEYIMTTLRTVEGTDLGIAEQKLGGKHTADLGRKAFKFIERGWMMKIENKLVLTREGKLFADGIASELFEVD